MQGNVQAIAVNNAQAYRAPLLPEYVEIMKDVPGGVLWPPLVKYTKTIMCQKHYDKAVDTTTLLDAKISKGVTIPLDGNLTAVKRRYVCAYEEPSIQDIAWIKPALQPNETEDGKQMKVLVAKEMQNAEKKWRAFLSSMDPRKPGDTRIRMRAYIGVFKKYVEVGPISKTPGDIAFWKLLNTVRKLVGKDFQYLCEENT
jgi:hypothetical protein